MKEIISIYVQFEALEEQAVKVNESFLRVVFEPFGCLTGIAIMMLIDNISYSN
jgi:hypothetical protein